jgi:outer membrane protein insertion porin family
VPLTECWSATARYGLSYDRVTLDPDTYYTNGVCDAALAGQYLCDLVGNRWTSSIGYSLVFDSTNSRLRPTKGSKFTVSQDFAGLGGDTSYLRTSATEGGHPANPAIPLLKRSATKLGLPMSRGASPPADQARD